MDKQNQYPQPTQLGRWWYGANYADELRKNTLLKRGDLLLPLLQELKDLSQQPAPTEPPPGVGNFNVDLPSPKFTPEDELAMADMLRARGQDPALFSKLNYQDAYTEKMAQQAREAQIRSDALDSVVREPTISPVAKAAVANKNTMFKPQKVKVYLKDGSTVWYNAIPNLSGGYDHTPAIDSGTDALLHVPPSSPGALEKDINALRTYLGMSSEEAGRTALRMKIYRKSKTPDDAWSKIVQDVSTMDFGRYGRDQKRLYKKARELWQVAFPGKAIPKKALLETNYGDGTEQNVEQASDTAPDNNIETQSQIPDDTNFASKEEVRAAFQAGKLSEAEAIRILHTKFGLPLK